MGAATARLFAKAGARVFVIDVDAPGAEQVASDCKGEALVGDVSEPVFCNWAIGHVVDTHGKIDVLVTPATPSPAPRGLHSTGDPAFNVPWSYCGYPTVVLPIGLSSEGLPIGIQLVGQPYDEARLLAVARWVEQQVGFEATPDL